MARRRAETSNQPTPVQSKIDLADASFDLKDISSQFPVLCSIVLLERFEQVQAKLASSGTMPSLALTNLLILDAKRLREIASKTGDVVSQSLVDTALAQPDFEGLKAILTKQETRGARIDASSILNSLLNGDKEAKDLIKEMRSTGEQRVNAQLVVGHLAYAVSLLQTRKFDEARCEFQEALQAVGKSFGEGEALKLVIEVILSHLFATSKGSENSHINDASLVIGSGPQVECTQRGFTVSFQLKARERTSVMTYLRQITKEAEEAWGKQFGRRSYDDAYNNRLSIYSSLGLLTKQGPRLIDPDGVYRGRIAGTITAQDNISSISSDYGSRTSPKSIWYFLESPGRYPSSWSDGTWHIVADQS